jgi:hypothetical protein
VTNDVKCDVNTFIHCDLATKAYGYQPGGIDQPYQLLDMMNLRNHKWHNCNHTVHSDLGWVDVHLVIVSCETLVETDRITTLIVIRGFRRDHVYKTRYERLGIRLLEFQQVMIG